jgi:hypothetical protein
MVLAFPLLQLPGAFFDLGFLLWRQTVSLAQRASSGLPVNRIGDAATRPQSEAKRVLVFDWPACNGGSMVTMRYWPKVSILDRGQRVRNCNSEYRK